MKASQSIWSSPPQVLVAATDEPPPMALRRI
jgi:hypothetical protein